MATNHFTPENCLDRCASGVSTAVALALFGACIVVLCAVLS